jgi:hypothetical protein
VLGCISKASACQIAVLSLFPFSRTHWWTQSSPPAEPDHVTLGMLIAGEQTFQVVEMGPSADEKEKGNVI